MEEAKKATKMVECATVIDAVQTICATLGREWGSHKEFADDYIRLTAEKDGTEVSVWIGLHDPEYPYPNDDILVFRAALNNRIVHVPSFRAGRWQEYLQKIFMQAQKKNFSSYRDVDDAAYFAPALDK
ncbi:hypothetical protein IJJ27_04170 [bacterium]|nr:hypothetical protein [bacterium]MBQ6436721.1 hypothetical protein [bacterium]